MNSNSLPALIPFGSPASETKASRSNAEDAFLRFKEGTVPLETAEKMASLSRTTFWRFRKRHRVKLLTGRRICVADLLAGFEAERHGTRRTA